MSVETIEGIYRDGAVHLSKQPEGVQEAQVMVIFLTHSAPQPLTQGTGLVYGKYSGGRQSSEDDFVLAEWHEGDL